MTTDHAATRADIQAQIVVLRDWQRWNDCTARESDQKIEELMDQLLALEPEPS